MAKESGTQDLRDLVSDLGKLPAEMRKEMRPALKASANAPLMAARRNASWSSRIPGATTITTSFTKRAAGVGLKVNKNKAKQARAYENMGKPGQFRTKVFGNDAWVSRTARPFLWPAAEPWLETVDKTVGEVVDTAAHKYGFR